MCEPSPPGTKAGVGLPGLLWRLLCPYNPAWSGGLLWAVCCGCGLYNPLFADGVVARQRGGKGRGWTLKPEVKVKSEKIYFGLFSFNARSSAR